MHHNLLILLLKMAKQESLFAVTVYYRKANGICANSHYLFYYSLFKNAIKT